MREIKFRAWDIEQKTMTYSKLLEDFFFHVEESDGAIREWARVMQYTGLKDRQGKEIYEGDIVTYLSAHDYKVRRETRVVRFSEGVYRLYELSENKKGSFSLELWLYNGKGKEMEVIGNIYEDGDLLNGE